MQEWSYNYSGTCITPQDVYLAHHGVLGMKWGHRKNKQKSHKQSKHYQKLYKKYKDKGYTERQAKNATEKRIKTEKSIALIGGITLALGTAYGIYKHHDYVTDSVLKSGKTLQNISNTDKKNLNRAFYSSKNKHDNLIYRGLYGTQNKMMSGHAFKTTMNVDKDLKIASPKNAKKIFNDMVSTGKLDKETIKSNIKSTRGMTIRQQLLNSKAMSDMKKGNFNTKSVYDAFNSSLVAHDKDHQIINDSFFKEMKKHGYDAIRDMNDSKYSGYNTKNPLIIFGGLDKIKVTNTEELKGAKLARDYLGAVGAVKIEDAIKVGSVLAIPAIADQMYYNQTNKNQGAETYAKNSK